MRRPTSCHRRHHRAGTHHQDTRPPTKPRPASPLNSSFTGARPTPPRSQRPVRRTLNVRDDRQLCASIYQLALCPRAAVREPPTQSSVNRPRPSCWQHHNTADLLSTESSTQSIWGKGRLFFLYACYPRAIQTSKATPAVLLRSPGKARYASYPRCDLERLE